MRSRWRTYGPTFRWTRFRLMPETQDGAWQPIRLMQIVGGRWWSLSLTRTAPIQAHCEVCGEAGEVRRTKDPDPRVPQVICVDLARCASRFGDPDDVVGTDTARSLTSGGDV